MAVSYSFHLSNKSNAVSTIQKIGQVSRHNLREYKSDEYDRNQITILRGSSESVLEDVKKIYHSEFDSLIEEYNEGKRADRQINDYLKKVSDSRNDVACEIIIQLGDKEFWKDKSLAEKKQMTYIFNDQVRYLEQLVPELKIASAVIHYDESSPHMHVVGVPIASGYKQGLKRQVAKTKVFTAERLSELQDKMRARAEVGMSFDKNSNVFGDEVLKDKEKGRNKDIPKYALDEYYKLEASNKELQASNEKLKSDNSNLVYEQMANEIILGDSEKKLKENDSRLEAQKNELKEVSEKADKAQNNLLRAEHRLNVVNKEIEEKEAKIEELEPLEARVDELEKEVAKKEKELDNWNKIIAIAEAKVNELQESIKSIKNKLINLFSLPKRAERIEAKERYFEALESYKNSLSTEEYEAFRKMDWIKISEMEPDCLFDMAAHKMQQLAFDYYDKFGDCLSVDGLIEDFERREKELDIPKFEEEISKGRSR